MSPTGTENSRLVVLRGPSGSGKSTIGRRLRAHLGRRVALIEQDYFRRIVLKERDVPGGANIELISTAVRFALDRGWHVVCEGIMDAARYGEMLDRLRRDHVGGTFFYYFDISLQETFRRHTTRPQAAEFGPDDMREWYRGADLLGFAEERVIGEESSLDDTVQRILAEAFGENVAAPRAESVPGR